MFTIRCTKRLLTRLAVPPAPGDPPTTILGDWTANLVYCDRQQFVLAVSERTFLTAIVPAAPAANLAERLRVAIGQVLLALPIDPVAVSREAVEMQRCAWGAATHRQALGIVVRCAKELPYILDRAPSLLAVALEFAGTPCSPLYKSEVFPDRATAALFARPQLMVVH